MRTAQTQSQTTAQHLAAAFAHTAVNADSRRVFHFLILHRN